MARCEECLHYEVCAKEGRLVQVDEHTWDEYNKLDDVEQFCTNYFTADVVPKSEYDAVVSAVDNSTKEFLKLHDDYQKAKREVERLEAELDDFTVASLAECKVCGEKTTKVIADLQKKLSNAKTEAASEIFEEFKAKIQAEINTNALLAEYGSDISAGRVDAYHKAIECLDKITKKHSEDIK